MTGRFINADDTSILQMTQGELLGGNLYAYCFNSTVMYIDSYGYVPMFNTRMADRGFTRYKPYGGVYTRASLRERYYLFTWKYVYVSHKQIVDVLMKKYGDKLKGEAIDLMKGLTSFIVSKILKTISLRLVSLSLLGQIAGAYSVFKAVFDLNDAYIEYNAFRSALLNKTGVVYATLSITGGRYCGGPVTQVYEWITYPYIDCY